MGVTFDLTNPAVAYMFGFLMGDGHLSETTRNRGRLSAEVSVRDEMILHRFTELVPCTTHVSYRSRETNFASRSDTVTWALHDRQVREAFKACGFPVGRKSESVRPPPCAYSVRDYLRGWVDADGSVGVTGQGKVFVSLTTHSEAIKDLFIEHVYRVTGRQKVATRNQRDGVFNLVVLEWMAFDLASDLYYVDCLSLPRKYAAARHITSQCRPPVTKDRRTWLPSDDAIVLNSSAADAAVLLGRTEKSIRMRRWRLTGSTAQIATRSSSVDEDAAFACDRKNQSLPPQQLSLC